jgi:hypothetical protein
VELTVAISIELKFIELSHEGGVFVPINGTTNDAKRDVDGVLRGRVARAEGLRSRLLIEEERFVEQDILQRMRPPEG